MADSNDGFVFPNFDPLRRDGAAGHVTVTPEKAPPEKGLPEKGGESPEQRMWAFHARRLTTAGEISLTERRTAADPGGGTEQEHALKLARAEAVEFVVKAFAAVDRNVALADKARVEQEKELAEARELRLQAEREAEDARSRAEAMLATARAESARIIEEAHARSRAEEAAARRRIVESLGPLRDVIGLASGTLDAFADTAVAEPVPDETAVDLRDAATHPADATVVRLPSVFN